MKITVRFPQVTKMEISTAVECDGTLKNTQAEVLKAFWRSFKVVFPQIHVHGDVTGVSLHDGDKPISSDQILQERLKTTTAFQVTFLKHASSSAGHQS